MGALQEYLFDIRLRGARLAAYGIAVNRRITPPQHGETFMARDPLHDALAQQPLLRFHGQEHHADTVSPGLRQ